MPPDEVAAHIASLNPDLVRSDDNSGGTRNEGVRRVTAHWRGPWWSGVGNLAIPSELKGE